MLKGLSLRQDILARWAVVGFLVFLCAPWVMSSNKHYHQLLNVLFWLPALLALCLADFRRALKQPEMLLFFLLSIWTLVVLVVQADEDTASKAKLPFYVLLNLLGVVLAAQDSRWPLERVLQVCILLGGVFAFASTIYFYWAPSSGRLIAIGLWDKAILAAHAVGALAVLGALLWQGVPKKPWIAALLTPVIIGYVVFLGMSQTRGVWLALLAVPIVILLARPTRLGILFLLAALAGVATIALIDPELFLQRGVSLRPALWQAGVELIRQNWLWGVGFEAYTIAVPNGPILYRHPHNLFLDTGVRLGVPGLLLFLGLWCATAVRGWRNRDSALGRGLLALWSFSSVALLTDGIGLWLKPNADWLVTWLPISLAVVLAMRQGRSEAASGSIK